MGVNVFNIVDNTTLHTYSSNNFLNPNKILNSNSTNFNNNQTKIIQSSINVASDSNDFLQNSPKLKKEKNEFLKFFIKDHVNEEDFLNSLSEFLKKIENASEEELLKIYQLYCSSMTRKISSSSSSFCDNSPDIFIEFQNINNTTELLNFLKIINEKTIFKGKNTFADCYLSMISPFIKVKFEWFKEFINKIKNYSTKILTKYDRTTQPLSGIQTAEPRKTNIDNFKNFIGVNSNSNAKPSVQSSCNYKSIIYPSNMCLR